MTTKNPWRGYALAFFAACGWASGGLVSKWIFTTYPAITPELLSAARSLVAALVLGIWLVLFKWDSLAIEWSRRTICFVVIFGAVSIAGMQYTYFKTISLTNVATAMLLEYLAPIFTLFAGIVFFKHRLRWQTVVGVACALIGCALAVGAFAPGGLLVTAAGIAWGLASAVFFALNAVMGGQGGRRFDPFVLLFYGMASASVVWLVVLGPTRIISVFANPQITIIVLAVAIVSTVLAFGAYITAMQTISPTHATVTAMVEPIVAAITASLLLGEKLTLWLVLGGGLVLGSIAFIQLAGMEGVEPSHTGPEPAVLPLDDIPTKEVMVARTGFEPVTSALTGRCPKPLDERATQTRKTIVP